MPDSADVMQKTETFESDNFRIVRQPDGSVLAGLKIAPISGAPAPGTIDAPDGSAVRMYPAELLQDLAAQISTVQDES